MEQPNLIVGIYGIQDVNDSNIATISHDHALAIYEGNKITHHLHLERINRKKHSCNLGDYLYDLLKEKKLLNRKCSFVFVDNVLGRSFINKQGNIRFEAPLTENLHCTTEEGYLWFLNKKIKAYALNHELAHIASCLPFFGAFKEQSLMIHFDGGASLSNFSAWMYEQGEIKLLEYHWDLKWLSSLYNANALVFGIVQAKKHELNSVPGKFMGYASFGKYSNTIAIWLKENNFFENCWKSKKTFFVSAKERFKVDLKHLDQKNPFIQDVAATIQGVFIQETLQIFTKLKKLTGAKYLYYSGGSALNILLNTELIRANLFDNVFIPPCCNDSGLALGAAAFQTWQSNNKIELISAFKNNWGIENYTTKYNAKTISETANLLLKKKVLGLCNNMGELGPRALGNRSIICLASDKKLAKKVSEQYKQREWYRPVAPIMLEKNAKYFTGEKDMHHLSKFMLIEFNILNDKKQELEGCVHADGTARIQCLFKKDDNPFLYDLLEYLDLNHQIKALINTSFNSKGEPIVHSTEHALTSANNMKLDAVILNGALHCLKND